MSRAKWTSLQVRFNKRRFYFFPTTEYQLTFLLCIEQKSWAYNRFISLKIKVADVDFKKGGGLYVTTTPPIMN